VHARPWYVVVEIRNRLMSAGYGQPVVVFFCHHPTGKVDSTVGRGGSAKVHKAFRVVKAEPLQVAFDQLNHLAQQPPLHGGMGIQQGRNEKAAPTAVLMTRVSVQPGLHKRPPELLFLFEDLTGTHQGGTQFTVEICLKVWQQFQAQAVALAPGLQVGTVLSIGEAVAVKIGHDLVTVAFQQWPDDSTTGAGGHAGEPTLASTTKKPEENLFSLIVGMMAQGHLGGPCFGHDFSKAVVAQGTCCHLYGTSMLFLPGGHIQLPHYNRQFQPLAKILDKTGIRISFSTAESMVDMAHNQPNVVAVPQPVEKMTETERIRTSGDSNQDPIARLEHSVNNDGVVDFFQQHGHANNLAK